MHKQFFVSTVVGVSISMLCFFVLGSTRAEAAVDASSLFLSEKLILSGMSITVEPEAPQPYETVRITINSVRIDLSRATISWFRNGKRVESATNQRVFSFTAGANGARERIGFVVATGDGGTIGEEILLIPTSVTLHWEAQTYTPVLYQGKALNTFGASMRVVAMPEFVTSAGGTMDPSTLVYQWRSTAYDVSGQSGIGRQAVTLPATPFGRETTVSVEISTRDGGRKAVGNITLPSAGQPELFIYELHPLLGIRYERAFLGLQEFDQDEVTLVAEPYFFSVPSRRGGVGYQWRLGGQLVSIDPYLNVKRESGEGAGPRTLRVEVSAENTREVLQRSQTGGSLRL